MLNRKITLITVFLFVFVLSVFSQKIDSLKMYFDINEYSLSTFNQDKLRTIIENSNIEKLYIYAYTDFLGSVDFNETLSNNRSYSTRNFLLSANFPSDKIIECKGRGIHVNSSEVNRSSDVDRGIAEHRKVEIVYYSQEEVPEFLGEKIQEIDSLETEEPISIPIFANLSDENLEVGENIVLENILFIGGTPHFKLQSDNALRQLYLAMKNNPTLIIEIQGHICCQSDDEDGWDRINQNNYLSENRAEAVYNYLVDAGIDESRMSFVGLGSSEKRFPHERSAREEDLNRRVEIYIVDK